MKTQPIVKEILLEAPVEKVWQAITDKDEMRRWYFDIAEFKPEVGFEFQFKGENEGRIYIHLCRVMEAIPNKKLKYNWVYQGYPGESFVTFELFKEGDKTRLKLTHEGLESFPQDIPDFDRSNFDQGWDDIINRSVKEYLEKN